jgi:hypothetical protein
MRTNGIISSCTARSTGVDRVAAGAGVRLFVFMVEIATSPLDKLCSARDKRDSFRLRRTRAMTHGRTRLCRVEHEDRSAKHLTTFNC